MVHTVANTIYIITNRFLYFILFSFENYSFKQTRIKVVVLSLNCYLRYFNSVNKKLQNKLKHRNS